MSIRQVIGHELVLIWVAADLDDKTVEPGVAGGRAQMFLAFDRLAARQLAASGRDVHFVDDLLTWQERDRLEVMVDKAIRRLCEDRERTPMIDGYSLGEMASFDLRLEWTLAARTFAATRRLMDATRFTRVGFSCRCPTAAVVAAARAAATGEPAVSRWVAAYTPPPANPSHRVRQLSQVAVRALTSSRKTRVLAVPGGKVLPALAGTPRELLRPHDVAVLSFPGLVHDGALKIALTKRLPLVEASAVRNRRAGPGPVPVGAIETGEDAELDAALRTVEAAGLARGYRIGPTLAASAATLDGLRSLRGLLLPSTSGAAAYVLRTWAARRGIACAVLQHGVYSFRNWDRRDRDSDILLAWGEGVSDQFVRDATRPRVIVVGTPGISPAGAAHAPAGKRILVITTNAPYGSLLGSHGAAEDFLSAVVPALRRLAADGASIRVRIHPSESADRYARAFVEASIVADVSQGTEPRAELEWATLGIGALSSFTCEAATSGVPILLWIDAPLAIRARHLVPPFDARLPASFATGEGLLALLDRLDTHEGQAETEQLRRRLASLAAPFDPETFADALAELAV